jgi:hypothetical protein
MRIASTKDGVVVQEFDTIREAGRAGFTISLIHRCIHGEAQSHKGYGWRRLDGVHGLDLWLAARLRMNASAQVGWWKVYDAFKASLHGIEADISADDFDAALVKCGWHPRSRSKVLDGAELLPVYPPGPNEGRTKLESGIC